MLHLLAHHSLSFNHSQTEFFRSFVESRSSKKANYVGLDRHHIKCFASHHICSAPPSNQPHFTHNRTEPNQKNEQQKNRSCVLCCLSPKPNQTGVRCAPYFRCNYKTIRRAPRWATIKCPSIRVHRTASNCPRQNATLTHWKSLSWACVRRCGRGRMATVAVAARLGNRNILAVIHRTTRSLCNRPPRIS